MGYQKRRQLQIPQAKVKSMKRLNNQQIRLLAIGLSIVFSIAIMSKLAISD